MVKQQQLDRLFAALSDPTRRAMIDRLAKGEASIGVLGHPHAMTTAGVMKHVRVLADAGLVDHRKVGRERICRLNANPLNDAASWIAAYERFWNRSLDNLEKVLEEMDDE